MENKNNPASHYWRNIILVLFIVVIIVAGSCWYLTEQEGPIPMKGYEDMCSEFTQMEGEISCMHAAESAMERTGETAIIDIEKVNLQGKNIYIVNFGTVTIEIDANTGEVV